MSPIRERGIVCTAFLRWLPIGHRQHFMKKSPRLTLIPQVVEKGKAAQ